MPWPDEMAHYIIHPQTLIPICWPWPLKDWKFNKFALDAIQVVAYTKEMMKIPSEEWTPRQDNFYKLVKAEAKESMKWALPQDTT